jgi:4-hydroxyphenylacetate 3-monooxygenase
MNRLREQPCEVWIRGERVKDVTTHPALQHGVASIAALYDMQQEATLREEMTYRAAPHGTAEGLSHIVPRTTADLEQRRRMMSRWAWASCGMMARTPDFLNVTIAAWGAASDYFGQNRPAFKHHIERYCAYVREHDLTLTHTLLNFQRQRNPAVVDSFSEDVALIVERETDAGLVVHGSRLLATLGPISDEIAVYPTRTHLMPEAAQRHSFAFAIPCATPGVKFLCRDSVDYGRSPFDHPLGARFDEMDAVVFFDHVEIPWERVFLLGDVEMCNNYGSVTHATLHSGHQVLNRCIVKAEFIVGLATLMVETLGAAQLPHVQERVGELILHLEMLKACQRAAEADAALDEWGVMCPAEAPQAAGRLMFARTIYPRMVEIIQLLGSSSFMALPSEADFHTPIAPEINKYFATDTATARERTRLFHLAWDVACSAFGGRQTLYERYFGGDPVRNTMMLYTRYDKDPAMQKVRDFLTWSDTTRD